MAEFNPKVQIDEDLSPYFRDESETDSEAFQSSRNPGFEACASGESATGVKTLAVRSPAFTKFVLVHLGRCGSTLLHTKFQQYSMCPPFELFNPEAIPTTIKVVGLQPKVALPEYYLAYVRLILGNGQWVPSQVVSVALTPWQLIWLTKRAPSFTKALFTGSRVLFLTRTNVIAQAVSYYRATQSGLWHSFGKSQAQPGVVSSAKAFERIDKLVDLIFLGEAAIEASKSFWTDAAGCQTLRYEELSQHPDEVVGSLNHFIFGPRSKLEKSKDLKPTPEKLKSVDSLYWDYVGSLPRKLSSGMEFDTTYFDSRVLGRNPHFHDK